MNRKNNPMQPGRHKFANVLYCGKRDKKRMQSGDGCCGPHNGPQCPDCEGFYVCRPSLDSRETGRRKALLLAMARKIDPQSRDSLRIASVEVIHNIDVYTQSLTSDAAIPWHHASFPCGGPRSFQRLRESWAFGADDKFALVVLDYYHMPDAYVEHNFGKSFIRDYLQHLVKYELLSENAEIWLPNFPSLERCIIDLKEGYLDSFYTINFISDIMKCPLVSATDMIEDELKMYDPTFDHFNQLIKLNTKFPFIQLVLK